MQHRIRPLAFNDIPAALELCRSAQWNQIDEDWSRLIQYEPDGCFAAEIGGTLVGTVTSTRYGTDLAWIGMMLVHSSHRRVGIGTELMKTALAYLHRQSVRCIKLDATPVGAKVYNRLGFRAEQVFHRWVLHQQPRIRQTPIVLDVLHDSHFPLDRVAFGADRSIWLKRLSADSLVKADEEGFGMLRPGFLADYMGPIVAVNPLCARRLLTQLKEMSTAKQVFWDVIGIDAAEIAKSLGFRPVRELIRMSVGVKLDCFTTCHQYAPCDLATG